MHDSPVSRHKVVIWGASGHALVVADVLRLTGEYEIAGMIDDLNPERYGTAFGGTTILGARDLLPALIQQGVTHLIFGFGDCATRMKVAEEVRALGFQFATAIHPQAIVARDVTIGAGTLI